MQVAAANIQVLPAADLQYLPAWLLQCYIKPVEQLAHRLTMNKVLLMLEALMLGSSMDPSAKRPVTSQESRVLLSMSTTSTCGARQEV
jgi:hypothetical protein